MDCTSGAIKTSGDVQVEAIDRENLRMEWTTKWIAADCGDVGQKKN
jgi:hypothetical protein